MDLVNVLNTTTFDSFPASHFVESDNITSTLPHTNNTHALYTQHFSASPTSSTATPFLLADIGEGIAEVELLQWFVSPGDSVAQFDRVCEVQSDKATVEITSRFDGVVESLNGEVGEMLNVGEPLMMIAVEGGGDAKGDDKIVTDDPGEMKQKLSIPEAPQAASGHGPRSVSADTGKVLTTPAVRKMAREHGIDLVTVVGSGAKGRVLKEVRRHVCGYRQQTALFLPLLMHLLASLVVAS